MESQREQIRPVIHETAWVAETATVRGEVTIGAESSVWYSAVIRGDREPVTVGERSNVQDGAVLHVSDNFPCRVGNDVSIGHGAVVHGCTVEDGALIGINATVLDGAVVGQGAMVGAGAMVPPGMKVPPGTLALGVPARIFGPLTPAQREMCRVAAEHYVAQKEDYRSGRL